jgi:hypothetical protein
LATWPETLPQPRDFLEAGYQQTPPDNLVVVESEVGPPAIRRRSRAGTTRHRGVVVMTTAELRAFRHWWREDLAHGAEPLQLLQHPVPGEPAMPRCYLRSWGPVSPDGRDEWLVPMELEEFAV